ncbi:TetR/AcrR family transcriptional regulator [Kribbella jejuensis]|uniref:TetR/AcrR family transcriptional regulator n=1 Tax=Kribbella jejuensis TaxID=236068 RepID=UPI00163A4519|nr:TetR/AcrR family transcriptional regulator [Kribbella jejuensis]
MTTKERITVAATYLLTEHGAAGVSMRKVAAAVGITPMAIYQYFPDRETLLNAVADTAFAELVRRWEAADRPVAADERLREMLVDHVDFALAQPRLYDYMFTERRDQARQFPADFRARRSPTLNLVADAVTAGVEQKLFRDQDIWETSLMFAALLHGLIQLHHGDRISMPDKSFRTLCLRLGERMIDELRV